jgi:hypothetical protein
MAICKGTVLARFFIGYLFTSNRFYAGAFFEFPSVAKCRLQSYLRLRR